MRFGLLVIASAAALAPRRPPRVTPRLSATVVKEPTIAPPLDEAVAPPTAAETDRSHGFTEGPSVAAWQKYTPPAEGGIDNLRAAAAKALQSGAKGGDAMRYYGYHLARATFFAGQGAAGVLAYQASASSAPYRGDPATTEPSKGPPRSPAFELPTLVDTMGALFAEAVATYEQDFGEVARTAHKSDSAALARRRDGVGISPPDSVNTTALSLRIKFVKTG